VVHELVDLLRRQQVPAGSLVALLSAALASGFLRFCSALLTIAGWVARRRLVRVGGVLVHFAERVMTVAHTARKQSKNVLAFITACCRARSEGGATPSLFAVDAA
jgi:hypothetical protein